jgi:hypothetical protein
MYELYTVRQFMNAWFRQDYSIISEEDFKVVRTEYIDTAGLYDESVFQKVCYIYFLNSRINSIALSIRLQKDFLKEFDIPYKPALPFLNKFGHRVRWNGDEEEFLSQLDKVEKREARYTSMIENEIVELKKLQKQAKINNEEEEDIKIVRERFIRTINTLGKIGYKIEYDGTTVEEMALMIKQQTEEVESMNNNTMKK